jgi:hypothetical protein
MTVFTETTHTAEFLCGELPNEMSRRAGVLNSGNNLAAGAVLARAFSGSAAAAVGSPSGTGTITIGAAGPAAQLGTYRLVCVAASSGAGTFNFYAPDGSLIRQITVGGGATVSPHYTITIADGTPDFAAGDTFEFQSTGGDYTAFDPGTNDASAILYAAVDATSADAPCVVVDHDAALVSAAVVWPDAITDDEKTAAMAQLEASGFSFR